MQTTMEHCWTYCSAPHRRSKWLSLCSFGEERHLVVADLENSALMLFDDEGRFQRDLLSPNLPVCPANVAEGVQNTLAVCDWTSNAICINFFDTNLNHQRAELLGRSNLSRPYSVVMTTVGNWAVADQEALVLLDPFGGLIRRVKLPAVPRHVTTDSKQRLIVSAPQAGRVIVCDPSGGPIRQLDGLIQPGGLFVNDLDQLLVCDQLRCAVALYDPRGNYLYDVIARDRSLPKTADPAFGSDRWRPAAVTSTTPGQVVLAAAYDQEFVIQCFAYDFMPKSARSAVTNSKLFSKR